MWEDIAVPLSEDERRILSEIEANLYETDPSLAKEVGSTTVFTAPLRSVRWAMAGMLAGFILMIVLLSSSFWLAFGGFLVMLAAALVLERGARSLGRVGIDQMAQKLRGAGRSPFSEPANRLRNRLREQDET